MPFQKQPLEDRIAALRADIDAYIDARVAEEAKRCPGVPAPMLRHGLLRGRGCACTGYLELKQREDEVKAKESAA